MVLSLLPMPKTKCRNLGEQPRVAEACDGREIQNRHPLPHSQGSPESDRKGGRDVQQFTPVINVLHGDKLVPYSQPPKDLES